jgi:hypothetical protein
MVYSSLSTRAAVIVAMDSSGEVVGVGPGAEFSVPPLNLARTRRKIESPLLRIHVASQFYRRVFADTIKSEFEVVAELESAAGSSRCRLLENFETSASTFCRSTCLNARLLWDHLSDP